MSLRSHDIGPDAGRSRGFTLVELLLAVGLLSILVLALLRLLDTSITIWERTDENRELSEMSSTVLELLASDVYALEGGPRGDLVGDWGLQDVDRDGIAGAPRARLRLVRHLDAAGLQRLATDAGQGPEETFDRGLAEVGWALLPGSADPDLRPQGVLCRGVRLLDDAGSPSFFEPRFFGVGGKPQPGSMSELTGGVLWFELWFASQTSVVHEGWQVGDRLADCSSSWDAWGKGRADATVSVFNRPAAGMPQAKESPLLPRRVRIALELERPADLRLRTRLVGALDQEATQFQVKDGRKLPPAGALILIDEEWMKVVSVHDGRVAVERARRATRAAVHPSDSLVHHGWRSERDITVDMTREDWDL